jgi:P4 family phage/plasmid primase-like protien
MTNAPTNEGARSSAVDQTNASNMALTPSEVNSVDFLEWMRPAGPWVLSALVPDGRMTTLTFDRQHVDQMRRWIASRDGAENLYFQVNSSGDKKLAKKASKADIVAADWLHVDVDPKPGEAKADILARIQAFRLRPSVVVDSGGGYQAFWRIASTDELDDVEAINRWLAEKLGGDNCHNIDRVMRLPGTTNVPNAKKRKAGREPCPARVVWRDESVWDRAEFGRVTSETLGAPSVSVGAEVAEVNLAEIHKLLPPTAVKHANTTPDGSRNEDAFAYMMACAAGDVPDKVTLGFALLRDLPISDFYYRDQSGQERSDPLALARKDLAKARASITGKKPRPDENEKISPWDAALEFVADTQLIRHQGEWLRWTGPHWEDEHKDLMAQTITRWLVDRGNYPALALISSIERHAIALRARRLGNLPAWDGEPVARHVLSCTNGLVDLETGTIHPHTPTFVNLNSVDYGYEPDAGEPSEWLRFLDSVWSDDAECIATLQRIFGYLLTPDTSMQRMFQLIGPPRSGKGTIGDVMAEVIGRANVCSPSLQSITGDFALQPAVGKLLMLLSEARLDGRGTNRAAITDVILRIVGEDHFTVNRKFKEAWQGVLPTRIVIQTNEPLELADDTGALLRRLIVLPMTRSFYGQEDLGLRDKLRAERGAILKWAMEGWRLLREEGGMIRQPASGARIVEATRTAASPMYGFVDECCELRPDTSCEKDWLYLSYKEWCQDNGSMPMTKAKLTQKLEANYPVRAAKGEWINKQAGKRGRPRYLGIQLLPRFAPDEEIPF